MATAIAILALALGIGVNSAVFTATDAILLQPLPFGDAERVVFAWSRSLDTGTRGSVSYPDLLDWRRDTSSFAELAGFAAESFTLAGDEARPAERLRGEWITPGYFRALGVEPILGRALRPEEDTERGAHPVVVIGHGLWQRTLGGDPEAVGGSLRLSGLELTVIGIAPAGFSGATGEAEAWLPFGMFEAAHPELVQYRILDTRGSRWHAAVGRLATGIDRTAAEQELGSVASALAKEYPQANAGRGAMLTPAREELAGSLRTPLLVLFGASALVLLLSCVNLVHLLIARGAARRRELMVRMALGARRGRLVRLLLTETLVLTAIGGGAGVIIAGWAIELLELLAPVELPPHVALELDGRAVAFAAAVTIAAGLLAGLVPALRASRVALGSPLAESSDRLTGGRRLRQLLGAVVVAETALALVLLIGAGLMVRSLFNSQRFAPGFDPSDVLTAQFELPTHRVGDAEQAALIERLRYEIAALRGVEAAAVTTHIWFGGGYMSRGVTADGPGHTESLVLSTFVSADYFRALGLPLIAGRGFTAADGPDTPPVAVVSESYAQRHWPNESALGRRIKLGEPESATPWLEVVGVARDVQPSLRPGLGGQAPQVYAPLLQGNLWARRLLVRTTIPPEALITPLRQAAARIDPEIPLSDFESLHGLLSAAAAETRFLAALLASFAAMAALLSASGVYGVMVATAAHRRQEIGIRLALGARRGEIDRLLLGRGLAETALGAVLGLAVALPLSRVLGSLVYGVEIHDPWVLTAAPALALAAGALGAWVPARRAARLDPVTVLRGD